eukprot:gb/GEZN01003500.1/.p2 GENE.gb/GEZN01003500.1/~~gb/GEZN01003500.1/.p2  ORF type:complete len:151 (-),score=18.16 gb/GEZN01003500.1/:1069-1521(-)
MSECATSGVPAGNDNASESIVDRVAALERENNLLRRALAARDEEVRACHRVAATSSAALFQRDAHANNVRKNLRDDMKLLEGLKSYVRLMRNRGVMYLGLEAFQKDKYIGANIRRYTSFYSTKQLEAFLDLVNCHDAVGKVNPQKVWKAM